MSRQSFGSAQVFPKYKIPVRVHYADNSTVIGTVFVRQGQRVLDLLCDERTFLPLAVTSGTMLVNKSHMRHVNVLSLAEIEEMRDLLPAIDLDYLKNNSW